jgi:hypothetical protein
MKTGFAKFSRALWPGIVLALAVAYLFQVAPHGHTEVAHTEPYSTHQAPANHTHAPDAAADEHGSADAGHHHHSVAQHLDFHSMRLSLRAVDQDHGKSAASAVAVESIPVPLSCSSVATEPAEPEPQNPLLPHAPSRAPPA